MAKAKTEAEIAGELKVARRMALAGFFLGLVAAIILRIWIPGFAIIGGAVAGASLGTYVLSIVAAFFLPYAAITALCVLIAGGCWGVYHLIKWERS
jgi:hypothetical protein